MCALQLLAVERLARLISVAGAHDRRFVDDCGPEADRLCWDTITLFGVHPQSGVIRGDWSGVLMPCAYPVLQVRADFMRKHLWTIPRHNMS